MRRSAFISTALHVAILLLAVASWPETQMDAPALVEIPIDVLPPTEVTKIKAGTADAKDEAPLAPKEEAPKPKAAAAPPPPPPSEPKPKPEEAKKPEPAKAETPQLPVPKPEPPKKVEAKPDKPKPKPILKADSKQDFNADRIAALLNKIPDAAQEPNPVDPADTPPKPVRGQSNGTQMTMSVNEIDALRARIAQCWSPPPGGLGADAIIVKLRLRLNEDGSLVGYPSIANSGSSPFFQAAADSAVRAVFQCQPYALPGEKYEVWRDMILTFDPRQMYSSG
jgi:outer membrane biosynthesis protein TonB